MMKKLYLAIAILTAIPVASFGQVFVQNTMFPMNKYVYNPAAAAASGVTSITGMYRAQWVGIKGNPNLATLGAEAEIAQIKGAVGGYFISDRLGPLATTGLNLSYAFRTSLGDPEEESTPTLSIGVNGGFTSKALNSQFTPSTTNVGEPLLNGQNNYNQSIMAPSLGAGIYFSGNQDKYYVGASVQDLLEPSIKNLLAGNVSTARVPRSYYVMGGYTFKVTERTSLQPNLAFRTDGRVSQLDLNVLANIKPIVVGLGYRLNDSFSGILGVNVSDRFFMGYSYDYTTSRLNAAGDVHSHEMILTYRFPSVERRGNILEDIFGNHR